MSYSPMHANRGIWQSPHYSPEQKLAGAVILHAIDDAAFGEEDALQFLNGNGFAQLWFGIVTPDDVDVEDVMSMCRRTVVRE